MSHCIDCGAPSYQSPCATCVGKKRDKAEAAAKNGQNAPAAGAKLSLDDFPRWRVVHNLLHKLWTKASKAPGYENGEWQEMEKALINLVIDGLGQPAPVTAQEAATVPHPEPALAQPEPAMTQPAAPATPADVAPPATTAPVKTAPPAATGAK